MIENIRHRKQRVKYSTYVNTMSFPDRDVANRTCNLECAKKPTGFTGLVKIILVDTPKNEYSRKIWLAGLIALAYIMMGFATATMFFFSLGTKLGYAENLHIFLCTFGFQLFIPAGILMISEVNGPSAPMTPKSRRLNHLFMQSCGLTIGLLGAAGIIFLGNQKDFKSILTIHFFAGITACGLAVGAVGISPFLFCIKQNPCSFFRLIHVTFGATAFAASSVCFITGVMKPSVKEWLPSPFMLHAIIAFCFVYTIILFAVPLLSCANRRTDE